jgi:hypothetical protein
MLRLKKLTWALAVLDTTCTLDKHLHVFSQHQINDNDHALDFYGIRKGLLSRRG